MPFVTIWGRTAMLKLIGDALRAKFGEEGAALASRGLKRWTMPRSTRVVNQAIATATSLDDVRRACAEIAALAPRRKKSGNGKHGRKKT